MDDDRHDSDASDEGNDAVSATFSCAVCGESAATVSLFTEQRTLPRPLAEIAAVVSEAVPDAVPAGTILISGFFTCTAGPVSPGQVPLVRDALERADPEALYAADRTSALFYCPQCGRCYCSEHWTLAGELPDDDPFKGSYWASLAQGDCPNGHFHLLEA